MAAHIAVSVAVAAVTAVAAATRACLCWLDSWLQWLMLAIVVFAVLLNIDDDCDYEISDDGNFLI